MKRSQDLIWYGANKMNVYVVSDEFQPLAVFTSKEEADKFKLKHDDNLYFVEVHTMELSEEAEDVELDYEKDLNP